jgi:hypothetical protein
MQLWGCAMMPPWFWHSGGRVEVICLGQLREAATDLAQRSGVPGWVLALRKA